MSEFNHLKEISVEELENAVAKAVSDLIGSKYNCSISNITYGAIEEAKFDVSISLHNDLLETLKGAKE